MLYFHNSILMASNVPAKNVAIPQGGYDFLAIVMGFSSFY